MRINRLHAGLWASAAALATLIVIRAQDLGGNAARAGTVSRAGEFTMLTTDTGTEDVLAILDNRSEQMMVYRVRAQTTLELMQNVSVAGMFEAARRAAGGR